MGSPDAGPNLTAKTEMPHTPQLLVEVLRNEADWNGAVTDRVLADAAEAAFARSGRGSESAELALLLCDDDEIRKLNKAWRGKDEPTNVLSFPLGAPHVTDGLRPLGDVALAYQTVAQEALDRGVSIGQHAAHLVIHGVLHLMGYDHMDDADAQEMESLEAEVLAGLGLPNPYPSHVFATGNGQ